jgi:uncharacterized protein YggE
LSACIADANTKAKAAAHALGARIVGVHRMSEHALWDEHPRDGAPAAPMLEMATLRRRADPVQLGFELTQHKQAGLRVVVEYRVEGFSG